MNTEITLKLLAAEKAMDAAILSVTSLNTDYPADNGDHAVLINAILAKTTVLRNAHIAALKRQALTNPQIGRLYGLTGERICQLTNPRKPYVREKSSIKEVYAEEI